YPQQRGCLRGRSLVEFEQGIDRMKYPLKRISWQPDDPHGELRGKEGYERISWEEALDYVAAELKKAYTTYGPRSVYVPTSLSGSRFAYGPLLNACGGYLNVSDTVSYGTYTADTDLLGIAWGSECGVNDRLDMIENADVVVMYAQNPAWSANGNPAYNFRMAHERGAQFVYVGPELNASAAMLDAHWIPVKPGGDTAFLIGVAGEMLKLDGGTGSIIDWDFLHTYCVGFDAQSMPEGAATSETFEGYLRGEYDGIEKDAAWASQICGTPEEEITWFAKAVGCSSNVFITHGYAGARCNGAEDLPQALMTIACMGGHFGKPGNACGNLYVDRQGPGGVQIVSTGDDPMNDFECSVEPLYDPSKVEGVIEGDYVNALDIWNCVIDGTYRSVGDCWDGGFDGAVERTCDIHVIYTARDGSTRSVPNQSRMPEAMRKVDFVLAQHYTTSPTTPFADIILPALANIERNEIPKNGDRDREMVLVYSKLGSEPYEAKSDQWIAEQILERLGYDPKDVYPYSEDQRFFDRLARSVVNDPDENSTPLVTITQQDIDAWQVEGEPQQGCISLSELCERGCYQVERAVGDGYQHVAFADFIADPVGNPLESESGKFEIYCQAKADLLNAAEMGDESYKPYPTYHAFPPEDGYPLLMFSTHYPRTACSDFGNVATLRAAWSAPVTMSAVDARELGVETGDAVLVSSPYGKIARMVSVTQSIIPGAIDVPNGSWTKLDEDGVDLGGNPNTLYGGDAHGMGVSGYNNVSVKVEKWMGDSLVPDAETQLIIDVKE
nr:molybdopterin-dependent oxidoreductase [Eggerthellaceae bacterium]